MITINNLSKTYQSTGIKSLSDITFNLKSGSVMGLVGTNGAGKSTLLRILAGIYKQDSGTLLIDGQTVFDNNSLKNNIAYISDDQYYPAGATLEDTAAVYALFYKGFSYKRFNEFCSSFGLDKKRKVNTFSKGMRRQGEVILSLSVMPKYLFCDETFDGLDPLMRAFAAGRLMADVADNGTTVILSSHNLREMEQLCDHIALIHDGRLLINRCIDDLKDNVFKVQLVFSGAEIPLDEFEPKNLSHAGKLISFIANGSPAEFEHRIRNRASEAGTSVNYYEALPLTLEEIFAYELNSRGLNKLIHGGDSNA
ncbi:MAG: ABC transporter ATP-binding protein [Oscillospiraceae bacterium]|nr:ABC transporter ATP-binding protein [Oscillospiraceae bacterium]